MNRNFQQQQQQKRRNEMWAWQEAKRKKNKRNKVKHRSVTTLDQDEKAGWLLFIERSIAFVFAILVGGVVFGAFGYFIGALTLGQGGEAIGGMIGMVLALPFAIIVAGNISRYRI